MLDSITNDHMLDVMHWLPVRQRIQHRVVSLVWQCQLGLAPAYLTDLCRSVSGAWGSWSLRSAERGFWWSRLPVQRLCRTAHSLWRALRFGMISLRSCTCSLDYVPIQWNQTIGLSLHVKPIVWIDLIWFIGHLKTYLFVCTGVGSASEELPWRGAKPPVVHSLYRPRATNRYLKPFGGQTSATTQLMSDKCINEFTNMTCTVKHKVNCKHKE